jgi:hypothetical protein
MLTWLTLSGVTCRLFVWPINWSCGSGWRRPRETSIVADFKISHVFNSSMLGHTNPATQLILKSAAWVSIRHKPQLRSPLLRVTVLDSPGT